MEKSLIDVAGGVTEPDKNLVERAMEKPVETKPVARSTEDDKSDNWETLKNSVAQTLIAEGKPVNSIDILAIHKRMDEMKQTKGGEDLGWNMMNILTSDMRANKDKAALTATLQDYVTKLDKNNAISLAKDFDLVTKDINDRLRYPKEAADEAFVDTVSPSIPDRIRGQFLVQQKFAELVDQATKDDTWMKKALDMGGLFVPFMTSKDMVDLAGTNPIAAVNALRNIARSMSTASPELKLQMVEPLFAQVLKATDNNKYRAISIMQTLMDPDGANKITIEYLADIGLSALDVGAVFQAIRQGAATSRNLAKVMESIGQPEVAGKSTAINLSDQSGKTARIVGQEQAIAHGDSLPIGHQLKLDSVAYTDNIHGDVLPKLREFEKGLEQMLDPTNPLIGDVLRAEELKALQDRYLTRWRVRENEAATGYNDIVPVSSDKFQTTYEITFGTKDKGKPFTTKKAARDRMAELANEGIISEGTIVKSGTGWTIKAKDKLLHTIDNTNEYPGRAAVGPIRGKILSPSMWMAMLEDVKLGASEAVNSATRAILGRDVLIDTFNKMINEVTKPLGNVKWNPVARKKLDRVDQVLLQGDAHVERLADGTTVRGKMYSPIDLDAGIHLPDGTVVHLDDAEKSAYYGIRRVIDSAFVMKNQAARRTMEARGLKNATIDGADVIVRPYESADAARAALRGKNVQKLFNPLENKGIGKHMAAVDIDMEELYKQGYTLSRTDEAIKFKDELYDYVFVKKDSITDLPEQVLAYKAGYVPKINKDAFYFIKEQKYGTKNGVHQQTGTYTHRIFDSKKEADAYLKKMQEARITVQELLETTDDTVAASKHAKMSELGFTMDETRELGEKMLRGELSMGKDDLFVIEDRNLATEQLNRESLGLSGGLYNSKRATHDIFFGVGNEVPKRYSAMESTQRYLQHVSNYYPRNAWRIAEQERWLKTAKMHDLVESNVYDFRQAVANLKGAPGSPKVTSLQSAGDYILDMSRIPTAEEQWFGQMMKGLAEWAEKPMLGLPAKAPKAVRTALLRMSDSDPISMARAASFHHLLGFFRPDQLFVQAQGASIAMSLHPEHWLNSMHRSTGLMFSLYSRDPKYAASVAKKLGLDADEFVAMKSLWDRTGLLQSVKSTADHAAAAQGFGLTRQAFKDVADKGLIFYRNGELFTRTYSFSTAVAEWLKKNPGRKISSITNEELQSIIDYTNHISLNMMESNRASFQKGLISLPTQFMQVQAKWLEALFPIGHEKFPRSQRIKALLMQGMIYGAAGVPMGKALFENFMTWAYPDQQGGYSKEALKLAKGGVWDWAFYSMFAADNEFGIRGAMVEGLDQTILDVIYGDAHISGLLGPAGKTGSAMYDAVHSLWPMIAAPDKAYTKTDLLFMADKLGQLTKSWSNVSKALLMHQHNAFLDGQFRNVYRPEEGFNFSTKLAQALGFRTTAVKEVYDMKRVNKMIEKMDKDIADSIVQYHYEYLSKESGISEEQKANWQSVMTYFYQQVNDPIRWNHILNSAGKRVQLGQDMHSTELNKFLKSKSHLGVDGTLNNIKSFRIQPYTMNMTNEPSGKNNASE